MSSGQNEEGDEGGDDGIHFCVCSIVCLERGKCDSDALYELVELLIAILMEIEICDLVVSMISNFMTNLRREKSHVM